MNSGIACVVLAALIFCAKGEEDKWKELRITYNKDKDAKGAFDKMPSTRQEAIDAKWKLIGAENQKCNDHGKGYRYSLNDDPAAVLIFGENGQLFGFESGFPQSQIKNDQTLAWFKKQPMFCVRNQQSKSNTLDTLYSLTVYFHNPDKICEENPKLVKEFYYKNGTNTLTQIPLEESKLNKEQWVQGKCTPEGADYFYEMSKDMNCDYFQPFLPLYEDQKLIGFSFLAFGDFNSERYGPDEHHDKSSYGDCIKIVPDCLDKVPTITTLHAYLIEKPWEIKCPKN